MSAKVSTAMARKLGLEPKKRKRGQATVTTMTGLFEAACVAHGLMEPVPEYVFAPPRKWAFDWAWPEHKIVVEQEGGIFAGKPCPACGMRRGGRHNSGVGMQRDMEKYNLAAITGWRVLRVTPQQVESGEVFALLKAAIYGVNTKVT